MTQAIRGVALLSVVALLGVLGYYLPQEGYSHSRLALVGLLSVTAVLGGIGVLRRRPAVTGIGVLGLFLLGFWQAVLSVFIYPVIALLVVATLVGTADDEAEPPDSA